MNTMIWIGAITVSLGLIGWMLFMMTFKPEVWRDLVDAEQKRKEKRDERIGKAVKGAVVLAKWLRK